MLAEVPTKVPVQLVDSAGHRSGYNNTGSGCPPWPPVKVTCHVKPPSAAGTERDAEMAIPADSTLGIPRNFAFIDLPLAVGPRSRPGPSSTTAAASTGLEVAEREAERELEVLRRIHCLAEMGRLLRL